MAEAVQTNMVSTKTPKACTKPCLTGWDASAVAAALGTEPIPASLEKRPRLIPVMSAMPKAAPVTASTPKALLTIKSRTSGTSVMFITVTTAARSR